MNKYFKFISMVLSIVLCFSAMAFGQETTGSIEGTVNDQAGAAVPGATVKVESTGSTAGFNRTLTTNDSGTFRVKVLPQEIIKLPLKLPTLKERREK